MQIFIYYIENETRAGESIARKKWSWVNVEMNSNAFATRFFTGKKYNGQRINQCFLLSHWKDENAAKNIEKLHIPNTTLVKLKYFHWELCLKKFWILDFDPL